ncbi:hypothetical protein [Pantoea sp. A4]|uniref:hypothetical protein n=1 Tax=Pantoea sp. A4 TaxID=1225184 RepID=UPI000B1C5E0C|nr:hypothetical protein [Pantoea sp. A4]
MSDFLLASHNSRRSNSRSNTSNSSQQTSDLLNTSFSSDNVFEEGVTIPIAEGIKLTSSDPEFSTNKNNKYQLKKSKKHDKTYKYILSETGSDVISVTNKNITVVEYATPETIIPAGRSLLLLNNVFSKISDGNYKFNLTVPDSCIQSTEYILNTALGQVNNDGKFPFLKEARDEPFEERYSHNLIIEFENKPKKNSKLKKFPALNISQDENFREKFVNANKKYSFNTLSKNLMVGNGIIALNTLDPDSVFHISAVVAAYAENGIIKTFLVSDADEKDRSELKNYSISGGKLTKKDVIKLPKITSIRMIAVNDYNFKQWQGYDPQTPHEPGQFSSENGFLIGKVNVRKK